MELPRYKSHKVVAAGKITGVTTQDTPEPGTYALDVDDGKHGIRVAVPTEWIERHKPEVGGYYVVYEDGYASYSPAIAFEGGYTAVIEGETLVASVSEASDEVGGDELEKFLKRNAGDPLRIVSQPGRVHDVVRLSRIDQTEAIEGRIVGNRFIPQS